MQNGLQTMLIANIAHGNLDLLRKQTYKVFLQTIVIANIAHRKLVLWHKQTYTVFFWCAKNWNKFMQNGLQTMLIANIAHCNLVCKQTYNNFSGVQKIGTNLCELVCKQCLLQTLPIASLSYCANKHKCFFYVQKLEQTSAK
jgi:hypothetical protein